MRRHDDAARAGPVGTADHGTEVPRVADLVEAGEKRGCAVCELECVGVTEWLAPRNDPLMVARTCSLGEIALELRVHPWSLDFSQPRLTSHRPLAHPQLEDLSRSAQRLTHRAPAVDQIARHGRRTSW
jgi:hypothetical protein